MAIVVAAGACALFLPRAAVGNVERAAWLLAIAGIAVSGFLQHRADPQSRQAVDRDAAHASLAVALLFMVIGRSLAQEGRIDIICYAAGLFLTLVALVFFVRVLRSRPA